MGFPFGMRAIMSNKYFFNPYNFVSTPKRNLADGVLGDARPIGHSRIEEGTLSGKLVIKMVAETPILIPSSDVAVEEIPKPHSKPHSKETISHRSRKTRTIGGATDNAGEKLKPFVAIPSSSVKGMVRSAYEMITNSRYSVFAGHDEKLGMRLKDQRTTHPKSPLEVLDATLRPAEGFKSFSSAERIFGWASDGTGVVDNNRSAYAGHLRFSPVCCKTSSPVEKLDGGRILAILNSPKPTMARFYAGIWHEDGETYFDPKTSKANALYDGKSALRGRKVYPHHGSFDPSSTKWRSPEKSNVNQSILDWIKPEAEFEFSIQFRNITPTELGGLIASIQTDEGQCHRLGGGRPLGFGAVSLKVDFGQSKISTQQSLSQSWENCDPAECLSAEELLDLESKFRKIVQSESFYKTFISYLDGYANAEGIQVMYPRSSADSNDPNAILEWFVANERAENGHSLPQIGAAQKNSLPFISRPPKRDNRGGNNNRGGHGGGGGRPRQ